jgi:pyruvate-ferredoxin/flavodoxin oxidoreductase
MSEFKNDIIVIDGNEAAADAAYRSNEICIIYPITPSSTMGELADQWSAENKSNAFGTIPDVVEMQSEAGAAGAIHGALQTGALATTFTASQGLLLMIPNMYRIAAELTPAVFHVSARAVAPQGMSIYCDHSDAMAIRSTGFVMICSANSQESHDLAMISQMASLQSRIPFFHFFDGFRTSHEVRKVLRISDEQIRELIDANLIHEHRQRRMCPENPFGRGLIYNFDVFFQQRETVNPYYEQLPAILDECTAKFAKVTGRKYKMVEYFGDPNAEQVIILMGSGTETVHETTAYLNGLGQKVGMMRVRLFQPFPTAEFLKELPKTCKSIAILDRMKEPGANGEPLYQKVITTIFELHNSGKLSTLPKLIGGRFGIGSKEFTPGMVKAIFEELKKPEPRNHFTIGIDDDVTNTSLPYDKHLDIEKDSVIRAVFYGLGADGTVSANKNTIKIIGEETDFDVQGYFVYDSKKSGSRTVSHLRFGADKIYSTYLIRSANFIAVHQFNFVNKFDVLKLALPGATLLLNSPYSAKEVWDHLPCSLQDTLIKKKIKLFVIDAYRVASENEMGERINTIMQTCFFALSNVLPREEAIAKIKSALKKTYGNKGQAIIDKNFKAVDETLANLHEVKIPAEVSSTCEIPVVVSAKAPKFVKEVTAKMIADLGDDLTVGQLPPDGTYPIETTKWEKRNVSLDAPVWDPNTCIQCGRCNVVCPHSIIRVKTVDEKVLEKAPASFKSAPLKGKDAAGQKYILQTYPEDCTGCGLCEENCPVKTKAIKMDKKEKFLKDEQANIEFFETIPYKDRSTLTAATPNAVQYLQPLFEFCGSCTGCGESPYVKLVTQLFGDRMIIANACGCSSVYGGNLPTLPWVKNSEGYGPSWSSSLFEDNAEFGFGFRLTEDKHRQQAIELLNRVKDRLNTQLIDEIINAEQKTEEDIYAQRKRIASLKKELQNFADPIAKDILSLIDHLAFHSIWSIGGDGWAYDIGFGGLDHVIASGRNINLLVLDTEVYSNTGGQASKATPRGSVVKFAASGKSKAKKDLGLMAMSYGDVYVTSIAMGANMAHAIKAIKEAESYQGPSIILAYSHCIAHGIDMRKGMQQQELAVKSGYWPLYRYNPDRVKEGLNPFQLDYAKPSIPFAEYARNENRFKILAKQDPERAKILMELAQGDINRRWEIYSKLAG